MFLFLSVVAVGFILYGVGFACGMAAQAETACSKCGYRAPVTIR